MNKHNNNLGDIANIDYSTFVGLINERNRPSGGIKTVHTAAVNALIDEKKRMLEIGSNTGFTSVNMSLLTGCNIVGIDINEQSVKKATQYAREQGVENQVQFVQGDAVHLPFQDNEFDIVWASNVTSFIADKKSAVQEYLRVLRPGGTLIVVPIYYIKKVPDHILQEVSKAIGVTVERWNKKFWLDLFASISDKSGPNLEIYYDQEFKYLDRTNFIPEYIEKIIEDNIGSSSTITKKQLKERFSYFMRLFNENLKYAGFSIFLFQKRMRKDEMELFLSQPVRDM